MDYIIEKEHEMLREELNNLKKCQLTFFTTSVTATGLILTVAAKIGPIPIAFLLPLIIIIPSSIIFYDKAWSISRIVGYYRILERFILNKTPEEDYIGWENALKELRDLKTDTVEESLIKKFLNFVIVIFKDIIKIIRSIFKPNLNSKSGIGNYLNLIYVCFFGLGLFCIYIYFISASTVKGYVILQDHIFLILISVFILSFFYNFKILRSLTSGKRSYDSIEEKWEKVFENYKKKK